MPKTSGNQILLDDGTPFRIAGVSWFGLESPTLCPHGLWGETRNWQSMMNQMVELGFNTLRLPFSNQALDSGASPTAGTIDYTLNSDLQGKTSLQIMDKIVDYAEQIGLKVILDCHRNYAGTGTELAVSGTGNWYEPDPSTYTETRWVSDWAMLAGRYANNKSVIGAELFNEPHGDASWGDGIVATDWKMAAQRAGNAVVSVNPNWLVFVQGIQNYNGSTFWWGSNLRGAETDPITLSLADKVVYMPHVYPPSIYQQPWVDNNITRQEEILDANYGFIHNQGTAPVVLGEFGSKNPSSALDANYMTVQKYHLQGDRNGDGVADVAPMGAIWWSWNPNSADTGGILMDDWKTADPVKMQYLNSFLITPAPTLAPTEMPSYMPTAPIIPTDAPTIGTSAIQYMPGTPSGGTYGQYGIPVTVTGHIHGAPMTTPDIQRVIDVTSIYNYNETQDCSTNPAAEVNTNGKVTIRSTCDSETYAEFTPRIADIIDNCFAQNNLGHQNVINKINELGCSASPTSAPILTSGTSRLTPPLPYSMLANGLNSACSYLPSGASVGAAFTGAAQLFIASSSQAEPANMHKNPQQALEIDSTAWGIGIGLSLAVLGCAAYKFNQYFPSINSNDDAKPTVGAHTAAFNASQKDGAYKGNSI